MLNTGFALIFGLECVPWYLQDVAMRVLFSLWLPA